MVRAIVKSNDPTLVSFVTSLLTDAGIRVFEWDSNMSVVDGSIGILPRRLMVPDEDHDAACRVLREAGLSHEVYGENDG